MSVAARCLQPAKKHPLCLVDQARVQQHLGVVEVSSRHPHARVHGGGLRHEPQGSGDVAGEIRDAAEVVPRLELLGAESVLHRKPGGALEVASPTVEVEQRHGGQPAVEECGHLLARHELAEVWLNLSECLECLGPLGAGRVDGAGLQLGLCLENGGRMASCDQVDLVEDRKRRPWPLKRQSRHRHGDEDAAPDASEFVNVTRPSRPSTTAVSCGAVPRRDILEPVQRA